MNIKKELVNTFRSLLNVYFGKVYTKDEIKISDYVVGGSVEMIGADGTLSPAPDGEYVMDSGEHFIVKDGKIESMVQDQKQMEDESKIEMADAPPAPEVPAQPAQPTPEEQIMELSNKVDELESKFEELAAQVASMTQSNMETESAIQNFNSIVSELNSNIKTLANIPVEFSKTEKSVKVENEKETKMKDLVSILSKKK